LAITWALVGSLTGEARPASAASSWDCSNARDIALVNGRILTMTTPEQVSSVVIRDGLVVHVGPGGEEHYTPCTKVFDLKGRIATPGLIDAHLHFVMHTFRPGYDVRLDTATTVADVLKLIRDRAAGVPAGKWVSSAGGWSPYQLAEKRMPTLAELDAASPNSPVFLYTAFWPAGVPANQAATNSLGKSWLTAKGITVGSDGAISAENRQSSLAYHLLRIEGTPADQKRAAQEFMAYLTSVGVTTVNDMGGARDSLIPPGAPAVPSPDKPYDVILDLWREHKLTTRLRLNNLDGSGPLGGELAAYLKYAFPNFGDPMLGTLCAGEFITPLPTVRGKSGMPEIPTPDYSGAAMQVAVHRWCHAQHTDFTATSNRFIDVWEQVNATYPIADLHWRLEHLFTMDAPSLARLKKLGAGATVAPIMYLTPWGVTPYRTIVEGGIPVGAASDGGNFEPVNPWVHVYQMVTSKDASGKALAPDQTISRLEAVKLYTVNNAWFMMDSRFGSMAPGNFGDVVVLDRDLFAIPDDDIRNVSSVLTIVDGKVVHRSGDMTPVARRGR
jgi:predicted amidohydrolase YtcJ